MNATTPREIYQQMRRVSGYRPLRYNGTIASYHPADSKTAIVEAARRACLVTPRGTAALRDKLAEALATARRSRWDTTDTLQERLNRMICDRYARIIESRGGETTIEEKTHTVELALVERSGGLVLLGCSGWRHYSSRFGARFASLAYLCGHDDNGPWAVRVPGETASIQDALDFVEPAAVKKAREAGKRVLRQGDVYFVEQARDNLDALAGTSHQWDAATRTVAHTDANAPHATLHVPFRAKAVVQSVLRMGRTTGRRRGD